MSDEPTPKAESKASPPPAPKAASKKKSATKEPKEPKEPFVWGTGRRKAAVARVRIRPGDGAFTVNKRKVNEFFCLDRDRAVVRQPLEVTDSVKSFDVFVNVGGGGMTGQAGAVVLGLARALAKSDADFEPKLREHNLLSRDPRRVERKKYGQRGARRRFQFSKR